MVRSAARNATEPQVAINYENLLAAIEVGENLGQILKQSRRRRGHTLLAVAMRTGLSQSALNQIENRRVGASVTTMILILRYCAGTSEATSR